MQLNFRPTPTASSRKSHALRFIRSYWADHGESPSLREIAAAIGTDASGASRIVRALDEAGHVVHVPGQRRGTLLPDEIDRISTEDALQVLRRRGWLVNDEGHELYRDGREAA